MCRFTIFIWWKLEIWIELDKEEIEIIIIDRIWVEFDINKKEESKIDGIEALWIWDIIYTKSIFAE